MKFMLITFLIAVIFTLMVVFFRKNGVTTTSNTKVRKNNLPETDSVDYQRIRLSRFEGKAVGKIDNFSITVYKDGKGYVFRAKDGDICSFKSPSMIAEKEYEVTGHDE